MPFHYCTLVLGALGLLALSTALDELEFGPEPSTELQRTWSETLRLEIDSLEETLDGNPVDLPFSGIEFEGRRSFEVDDEITRSAGGRPVDLTRGFASSSLELDLQLDGQAVGRVEGQAACDGSEVRFVFDAAEQGYACERIEGELDADRMEALDPDLDLLALLPEGALEPGATWSLEPQALRAFFFAGGDLGFAPNHVAIEMQGAPVEVLLAAALGSLHQVFGPEGELSGTVEASYEGMGTEDEDSGSRVARLEYELALESRADLGPRFRSFFSGDVSEATHALELAIELEGRLVVLWDMERRHLRAARFEGDALLTGHLVFPVSVSAEREPVEFVGDYVLSGEALVELVVE